MSATYGPGNLCSSSYKVNKADSAVDGKRLAVMARSLVLRSCRDISIWWRVEESKGVVLGFTRYFR